MSTPKMNASISNSGDDLGPSEAMDVGSLWHAAPSSTPLIAAGTTSASGKVGVQKVGDTLGSATGGAATGDVVEGASSKKSLVQLLAIVNRANVADSALLDVPVLTFSATARISICSAWTWYNRLITESINKCLIDSLGAYIHALFDACWLSSGSGDKSIVRDYIVGMIRMKFQPLGFEVEEDFETLVGFLENMSLPSGQALVRSAKSAAVMDAGPSLSYKGAIIRMRAASTAWVAAELRESVTAMCSAASATQGGVTYDPQAAAMRSAECAVRDIICHYDTKRSRRSTAAPEALDLSAFHASMTKDIAEWENASYKDMHAQIHEEE